MSDESEFENGPAHAELQAALEAVAADPAWTHKLVVLPSGRKVVDEFGGFSGFKSEREDGDDDDGDAGNLVPA